MNKLYTNQYGETFIETSDEAWGIALAAWKASRSEVLAKYARLESALAKAASKRPTLWSTRCSAVKRAMYRRMLPCPLPKGHICFGGNR